MAALPSQPPRASEKLPPGQDENSGGGGSRQVQCPSNRMRACKEATLPLSSGLAAGASGSALFRAVREGRWRFRDTGDSPEEIAFALMQNALRAQSKGDGSAVLHPSPYAAPAALTEDDILYRRCFGAVRGDRA